MVKVERFINNSAIGGAFIPLLTFGIPTSSVMALLLAGFMIHGIIPGPLLVKNNPQLFWGLIFSMYIGNVMLLVSMPVGKNILSSEWRRFSAAC